MGKELIALSAVLLLTAIYSLNDPVGQIRGSSYSIYGPALKTDSHIEVVRDGAGRVYPLEEARLNYIVLNGGTLEDGDLLEYVNPENSEDSGRIRRGRMRGEALLLFGMPLNLNEAAVEDLTALPGIGAKTAEAIVKFREEAGPFKTTEELMSVRGIGRKKFQRIRAKLTI